MISRLIQLFTKLAINQVKTKADNTLTMPRFNRRVVALWSSLFTFLMFTFQILAFQVFAAQPDSAKQSLKAVSMPFAKVTYVYDQGPFAGASYQVSVNTDEVRWLALAGPEQGKTDIEKQSAVLTVAEGVYMITWLEHVDPYTVTVTINTNDNTMIGIVSNESGHYVNSGKITAIE